MSSIRAYVTAAEVQQYANITITDATEGDDQISQAEEIIDAYVGTQKKAFIGFGINNGSGVFTPPDYYDLPQQDQVIYGRVNQVIQSGNSAQNDVVMLEPYQDNVYQNGYFSFTMFEIVGGTGQGQRLPIMDSLMNGQITIRGSFTTSPDTTSLYKIYQVGKFPRVKDVFYNTYENPSRYYKTIPEAVKRAVCAQLEYMITQGPAFFASQASQTSSEHIGDYSYRRSNGAPENLIAPKAQMYLRGIRNLKGEILT